MCILSYLPPHAPVDDEGLFNGGLTNPDGHGWAIVADDKIIMGKSLDLMQALETFIKARDKYMDGPALFHSRWATHGTVRVGLAHPFLVGGSHLTVVAHNGILPTEAHPKKGDDRSDTLKFADEILPQRYHRLDKVSDQQKLAKWCGRFNKLVILTVDPRYQSSAYIVNQAAGQWDSKTGLWHSNGDYLDPMPRWASKQSKSKEPVVKSAAASANVFTGADNADEASCEFCGIGEIGTGGYCLDCRTCQECYETMTDCTCWNRVLTPAR